MGLSAGASFDFEAFGGIVSEFSKRERQRERFSETESAGVVVSAKQS